MTETRQLVSIRLTKTLLAQIDLAALEDGETRTGYIEAVLAGHFAPKVTLPIAQKPVRPPQEPSYGAAVQNGAITKAQAAAAPILPCSHPKTQWQHHPWGKTCGTCGQRL